MRLLLLVLLFPLLTNAQSKGLENLFYKEIRKQTAILDSLRFKNSDSVEVANNNIINIIKKYRADIFNFKDTLNYYAVYITKSADKNFALVSWDTRQGGTMIDFASIAIFKTSNDVHATLLIDSTDDTYEHNTMMHYDKVYTITTIKGKKIYLAYGLGQGSSALPWQEIRAFSIEKDKLLPPNIFPGDGSRVFVEFDTTSYKENERTPRIRFSDGGKKIEIPVPGENENITGKFVTLAFNGEVYKPAR